MKEGSTEYVPSILLHRSEVTSVAQGLKNYPVAEWGKHFGRFGQLYDYIVTTVVLQWSYVLYEDPACVRLHPPTLNAEYLTD